MGRAFGAFIQWKDLTGRFSNLHHPEQEPRFDSGTRYWRPMNEKQKKRFLADLAKQPWRRMEFVQGAAEATAAMTDSPELKRCHAGWQNNIYAVWHTAVSTEWGVVDHLWVRRHDGAPVRSWADMQRVKREALISGPERFAVEVYPPDAEVVDSANMYHLWVLPPGFRLPFALRRDS